MPWFKRRGDAEKEPPSHEVALAKEQAAAAAAAIPAGLYVNCAQCGHLLYAKDFERDLKVCSRCGHHHPLTADERVAFTVDAGSWVEHDAALAATDPLEFPDYAAKMAKGRAVTGRADTMVGGSATVGGYPVELLVADFRFMGGSMGSVFGEKFVRAADRAIESRAAVVAFVASGGARMQEGLFGLMQMAKTSAAVAQLSEERLPYVVVLTNPTTGGAIASFASLGDVILAEPGAYVAFAGARVAQQAKTSKEPENYQSSEFQFEHGMVDRVVARKDLPITLARSLAFFGIEGRKAAEPSANGANGHAPATPVEEAEPVALVPPTRNGKGAH